MSPVSSTRHPLRSAPRLRGATLWAFCVLVLGPAVANGSAAASAPPARTPAVWCLADYYGPAQNHRFVALRRPSACVLEIIARRGDLADPDPPCCITDVYRLHWISWTSTRAVGVGMFAPSVPAQGTRSHARVVLSRPEPGCLNGAPSPVVFTRARVYPGIGGTEFYQQNLPLNPCVV